MTATPEVDDLDAAYAEISEEPYRFTFAGRQWSLPHMSELDYRTRYKVETFQVGGDIDDITNMLSLLFEGQAEEWQKLRQTDKLILMLFQRWMKHSGAEPGEEQASTDSSGNTGGRSRPTSGATTASASRKRSTAGPAKKTPAKKAAAKRAPRKAAKAPTAAELAERVDADWLAKHQALAGSPPGSS